MKSTKAPKTKKPRTSSSVTTVEAPRTAGLKTVSNELLFSRHDPEDPRLGEFVQTAIETTLHVTLWGYPDDEGIQVNGGRLGAAEAPDAIRKVLYRMTPGRNWPRSDLFLDLGNWQPGDFNLEQRHDLIRRAVAKHYQNNQSFLITLGGGHDFGFPDGAGFIDAFAQGTKPVIINFDAHLDVRPLDRGISSGTPFRRLYENFPSEFELIEVGIQPQCNSPFHLEWALSQGATILTLETIRNQNSVDGLRQALEEIINTDQKRPLWISLDIDAFSSREAPGCSASWPTGLSVEEMLRTWTWLFSTFDVKGLGIYEVSPPLDMDGKTSKLAALMIYQAIHELFRNRA